MRKIIGFDHRCCDVVGNYSQPIFEDEKGKISCDGYCYIWRDGKRRLYVQQWFRKEAHCKYCYNQHPFEKEVEK